ncbi:5-formyltetrahydrofolate cyclo-ligase [Candidatus Saccharibacteria bacterium]|nr:MAG: 5-formyltetrahydrofolate cyclo-ligase [Candidatus Saccharibacteria bacterium]
MTKAGGKKDALRRELLARRSSLRPREVKAASAQLAARVQSAADWSVVRSVHIYDSLPHLGEVETRPIIDWLAAKQPHVTVTIGQAASNAVFPEEEFDVIFVPVVGFDREGFRLGMGGGWYDRWLAAQPQAQKIGLAYAWAELPHLPHEAHDIPLDCVVTEKEVIVLRATGE